MRRTRNETQWRKNMLKKTLIDPKAKETKMKYRAIRKTLVEMFPHFATNLSPEQLLLLVEESIALDREWRKQTKEYHKEQKMILSQEWKLNNGYEPNYYQDVQKLKTLQ